jgi:hypothetical protein
MSAESMYKESAVVIELNWSISGTLAYKLLLVLFSEKEK